MLRSELSVEREVAKRVAMPPAALVEETQVPVRVGEQGVGVDRLLVAGKGVVGGLSSKHLGLVYSYELASNGYGDGVISPWQENFLTQVNRHIIILVGGLEANPQIDGLDGVKTRCLGL